MADRAIFANINPSLTQVAERAQRETEEPAFDLLGQSNMMASFQGGGAGGDGDLDFGLDEYGGGV